MVGLSPIQKILKRKAENKGKCEVCKGDIGKKPDYLCEFCRNIKTLEIYPHRRPNSSAAKCPTCKKALSKEDIKLSKSLKRLTCWECLGKKK